MKQLIPIATGCALVGIFLGVLLGYTWHATTSQTPEAEQRQPPPATVDVEVVEPGPLVLPLQTIGALRAPDEAVMRSLVSGVVREVAISDGQEVAAGDLLIQVEDAEQRQLLAAERARRDEAKRSYERAVELEERGIGTSNETERLRNELAAAEGEVAALAAQVAEYRLLAPFSGRVGLREVSKGNTIAVGDRVTTVTSMDPLRIASSIPERYVGLLQEGLTVRATTPAFSDKTFNGNVVYISPQIDPATRSVRIEAAIDNSEGFLRPGQTLDVEVVIERREGVITVAEEALILRGDSASVWVIADGKAQMRRVELGRVGEGRVEIRDGLTAGDEVVVRGIQKIFFPGMPAQVRSRLGEEAAEPAAPTVDETAAEEEGVQ